MGAAGSLWAWMRAEGAVLEMGMGLWLGTRSVGFGFAGSVWAGEGDGGEWFGLEGFP